MDETQNRGQFLPSPPDSRDKIAAGPGINLPPHVDLLPDVEEVESQLWTNTCTANAAASALELAYKRAGKSRDFSRLYNYWYSRQIGGLTGDAGAYPRDVCKALNKHGICLESTWEFDIVKNLNTEPPLAAQEEAKGYPVYEYARVEGVDPLREIKSWVAAGTPVMASIKIGSGFYNLGRDWKTHDWDPQVGPSGAHQVLIIGYNDSAERLLAQNSWGPGWADGGFFGIPYSRVGLDYYDVSAAAYEYWVLTRLDVAYKPASGVETDPYNLGEVADRRAKLTRNLITAIMVLGGGALWWMTR